MLVALGIDVMEGGDVMEAVVLGVGVMDAVAVTPLHPTLTLYAPATAPYRPYGHAVHVDCMLSLPYCPGGQE